MQFFVIDDLLKGIEHKEHAFRKISDSEVITTAIVSALYFGGHQNNAREFMKMTKLSPGMLDKAGFAEDCIIWKTLSVACFFR